MRKGKIASQVAHASMWTILRYGNFLDDGSFNLNIDDEHILHWLTYSFTRVVLACDSEEELLSLKDQAVKSEITFSLVKDNGTTVFNGEKTFTALAIGHEDVGLIDRITGHLKLL